MASLRTFETVTMYHATYLGFIIFVVFIMANRRCSAWDTENCPIFCQCYWHYGLKWANCTDHRLYSVQTGIDEACQALDLSNNSISSLANYELRDAGLTRLKLLNLSSNAISEIGLVAFVDLSQLRVLDLSKNHLYVMLPETFVRNTRLEVLELAGNNLNQRVPKLQSSSLRSLNLANCGISHLPSSTFDGLPRLRALVLTDNVMLQLQLDILKGLPNLAVIMIERNPWSCNSNMYELQKRLRWRKIIFKNVCNETVAPDANGLPKKFEKMIAATRSRPAGSTNDENSFGRLLAGIKNWRNSMKTENTSIRCPIETSNNIVRQDFTPRSRLAATASYHYWFLAVGFLLGSATSTVLAYLCLTRRISRSMMMMMNIRRDETGETESSEIANQRANLLENLCQSNGYDESSTSNCPGTPPPPYRDVMLHVNLYPRANIRG